MVMKLLQEIVYQLTIRPRLARLRKLLPEAKIHPTGSRYVCSPPVLSTDIDFLVYTEVSVDMELIAARYTKSRFDRYGFLEEGEFNAWRRGKVNLIVTSSLKYAEAFQTATHICRSRNVLRKYHRVIIHETVRGTQDAGVPNLEPNLQMLLESFRSMHGFVFHKAYRAKHGLVL